MTHIAKKEVAGFNYYLRLLPSFYKEKLIERKYHNYTWEGLRYNATVFDMFDDKIVVALRHIENIEKTIITVIKTDES